ncbi:MAG: hypothetical protein ACK5B9_14070 [Flavobacteriia bacterium]|jgi:hypothetical protein
MKFIILGILAFSLILNSCQNSVETNLSSGNSIKLSSEGMTCEEVEILVNGEKRDLEEYQYGDKISLNFINVEGLKRVGGKAFPGLKLLITNIKGDTMLFLKDVYENTEGQKFDPMTLVADITAANPMFSGNKFLANLDFWDKKGDAKLHAEFRFSTNSNELIGVKSKNISYKEIYIYSEKNQKVISDNLFENDDKIYFILEGLEGFKVQDGLVFPGCMIEVKNKAGEVILHEDNMLQLYYDNGINFENVYEKIYFSLNDVALKSSNELFVHALFIDRLSDAALTMDTKISLKK